MLRPCCWERQALSLKNRKKLHFYRKCLEQQEDKNHFKKIRMTGQQFSDKQRVDPRTFNQWGGVRSTLEGVGSTLECVFSMQTCSVTDFFIVKSLKPEQSICLHILPTPYNTPKFLPQRSEIKCKSSHQKNKAECPISTH